MCPNVNDSRVVDAFNEMVVAFGGNPLSIEEFKNGALREQRTGLDHSAMVAAYKLWDLNEGHSMDKTASGKESVLFKELLNKYNNKTEAIRQKSKIYTDSFKAEFGNWQKGNLNFEDSVDVNGEPTIEVFEETSNNYLNAVEQEEKEAVRIKGKTELDVRVELEKIHELARDKEKILKKIRKSIEEGTLKRIASTRKRALPNQEAILNSLKYQLMNIQDPLMSDIEAIVDFISSLTEDVTGPISDMLNSNKQLSNADLIRFKQDYLGLYANLVKTMKNKIVDLGGFSDIIGENYDMLQKNLITLDKAFSFAEANLKDRLVKAATESLYRRGINAKSPTIYDYVTRNIEETNSDISTLTRIIGAGDKMNDEAVRIMFDIIQRKDTETYNKAFEVGKELINLAHKSKISQKELYETDGKGGRTGYIARERRYGLARSERLAFFEELKKKYGLTKDELQPRDREARIAYNEERNQWLDDHDNRRYTKEYYDLFNALSEETRLARQAILFKMDLIFDKVKNKKTGKPDLHKLKKEDWDKLESLDREKRALASKYYSNGVKKSGIELTIAEELIELNKSLQGEVEYVVNEEKFKAAEKEAKENLTAEEFELWQQRNKRYQISQEFYDELADISKRDMSPSDKEEYDKLSEQRREIMRQFRDSRTGAPVVSSMPAATRKMIRALDIQISKITRKYKLSTESRNRFQQIALRTTTAEYKADKKKALSKGDEYYHNWELANHSYDINGNAVPHSYYTMIVPKDEKYISYVPSSIYSEVDRNSKYYNNDYDESNPEYYQPKYVITGDTDTGDRTRYDSREQYNKIMSDPDAKNLYETLLKYKAIADSNTNIPSIDNYLVPQISGSMYQFMKIRDKDLKHLMKSLTKQFGEYVADAVSAKNDDLGYNPEQAATRADGSKFRTIPVYYVERLENPNQLTNDLIGSVIAYYKMAENFKAKSEIEPELQVIQEMMANRKYNPTTMLSKMSKAIFSTNKEPKKSTETNLYKFVDKFIDMQVYGEMTKAMYINFKLNKMGLNIDRKLNISKLLNKLKNVGTAVNLGLNFTCASVGFTTAFSSSLIGALVGRYYDTNDFAKAWKEMILNGPKALFGVDSQLNNNKMIALMEKFEIASEEESIFGNTNQWRIARILKNKFLFGLYTMGDFVVKGTISNSIMFNHKLYQDQIVSKEDFLNNYFSHDKAVGKEIWKTLTSVYDMYEMPDSKSTKRGVVQVKREYQKYLTPDVEYVIKSTAQSLSASADGMLTPLQRTQLQANALGGLVLMHRQYLPQLIQERYLMDKHWDYSMQRYREAVYRTVFRLSWGMMKDIANLRNPFHKLDTSDKANMKQFALEMLLIHVITPLISQLFTDAADDDPKNLVLQELALIAVRSKFEIGTPYNPTDIYNTFKSPTAVFTFIDNFRNFVTYPIEAVSSIGEPQKRIKYGAYKNFTPIERSMIKLTPFKNVFELKDPKTKRKWFESNIDK